MLSSLLRAGCCVSALGVVLAFCCVPAAAGLPDGRADELVSSGDKLGNEVVAKSSRTHAAAGESPGLPAAVAFSSLGGFSDVRGTGIATEYLSQRDGTPGTSGWSVHAITPEQEPTSFLGLLEGLEPRYQADMSADLTKGVFWASTPLTDAPNVAHVPNLYLRDDLRTPGAGSYSLLTDAASPLPAAAFGTDVREFVAGTSDDFQHVLFESQQNLTSDASGTNVKLYKWDGAVPRLVASGPGCPGESTTARASAPCSAAGKGVLALQYTQRTLASDGSRAIFASPVSDVGGVLDTSGAASKLFQLDDQGTASTADDAIVQINASEAPSPRPTQAATFMTASTDGSRVFFLSAERLTTTPGGGLYLWERKPIDEIQSINVDATGGTFTLTAHAQPSAGSGTLSNGSTDVENVTGSFSVGQTITGTGIPAGTTIVAAPTSTSLTLSAPATIDGNATLTASIDATTPPLPANATAAQVQAALEGLATIGTGNVSVSGGPGGPGGASPYLVMFTGAFAGVDVARLSSDASGLSGGAASATVTVTTPVHNLTLIAPILADPNVAGVLGASTDGHRLYFAAHGNQLVSGGPAVPQDAIYYWQDADGRPGGTLSFIGNIANGDLRTNANIALWNGDGEDTARVTPDGRFLVFEVSDGSGLAPRYDQSRCLGGNIGNPNNTGNGCSEVYVYRADSSSPTVPDVVCASCNPSGAPGTASAWLDVTRGASATAFTTHLSHALSDDGRYVFFSTAEALVPEDVNGKSDAYEYDTTTDRAHLLSGGVDTSDSYFLDASADGHDVYFATRQQLVGWDTDNAYDLYDARIGGGFPEPPTTTVCAGDACQGPAAGSPVLPVLGSASFQGAGNARGVLKKRTPPLRCKHGQIKRRLKGKVRCVRRPKPKHPSKHGHTATKHKST